MQVSNIDFVINISLYMQRLTDIWQNLLSATRNEDEGRQNQHRLERLNRVTEAFENMYWTRIISLQDPAQEFERYPMTDDIIEAHNELDELNEWEYFGYRVFFDPKRFIQENPEPTLEAFIRDDDDLRHWAYRCTWIRQTFRDKIERTRASSVNDEVDQNSRSRIGMKMSRPSHNLD